MSHAPQIKIPATYMRGGTSKGVFFKLTDLPLATQQPGAARDALLLVKHQQDGHLVKEHTPRSRRGLPVRPGVDRQAVR